MLSSIQFSCSVVSDSLWPHELQHARPPCPSPTPGVNSNSCTSSQWCHPAISSSVVPFSSCPQSLPASESFPMSQPFSLSSFTFINRIFSSSSLSAIRVVSSAYLIVLPAILIPACAFSSPAFLMMYSAYKLNKQGDTIQPWHTPFPIWNQFVVPCPVLTVASWPAYRFLKKQVRWSIVDT